MDDLAATLRLGRQSSRDESQHSKRCCDRPTSSSERRSFVRSASWMGEATAFEYVAGYCDRGGDVEERLGRSTESIPSRPWAALQSSREDQPQWGYRAVAYPGSLCGGAAQANSCQVRPSFIPVSTSSSATSSPNCHDDACYARFVLPVAVLYIYISLCTLQFPSLRPPPPPKTSQRVFSGRNSPIAMRYQSLTLALCSCVLCIVARPTSAYALKSSLQRREDKKEPEKCFCFKLNDKPDPPVTCAVYVMSDKDDGDCKPADNARRCCDNECNEHGCDKPGQHFFGFDSAAGPENSMFADFGKKTGEEWEKAQNAANGKGFKTNKELEEEVKEKGEEEGKGAEKGGDKKGPVEGEDEDEEGDEEKNEDEEEEEEEEGDEEEEEEEEDEDGDGDKEDKTDKEKRRWNL